MRANLLGDIRAESDRNMLDCAFVETPDYKTLIGAGDRAVVIGRRGSGKSALVYTLQHHWASAQHTQVLVLAPEADQMLGLRPLLNRFGERFNLLRAASRIAWRYALLVHHQYPSAPEIKDLRTSRLGQRAHLPLEIPVLRRQTLPPCSVSSSSSSHSAPVRSGRCVGAEPTS